ncbi:hypothetical protein SAMN03080617_00642 [Algoriphagus alkaliphilus]|uniref:Uncharacterized protein n=1 Tax=Algoriphagus alkaliphilus TaxID=279824 RepID=A0A1G5VT62_9BACT|nr:TonB-dependent receptor [Algoriphagus alkaliphilus]SDA48225.1 hypothetical protein SAMN03080617_00642 [Algoriphagus alkaliphilus]
MIAEGSTRWIGFLLFTIVGERLELSQFLPVPTWSKQALGILLSLFFIGLVLPFHGIGNEVMGMAGLLISVWLLIFDMAKVAAKKKAQFRYIGVGLRVGYLCLGAQGLILLFMESHPLFYDLVLHTFFLGFTLLDLNVSYPLGKMLLLKGGIQSLLDETFFEHLSCPIGLDRSPMYAPGRNFFVMVSFKFP